MSIFQRREFLERTSLLAATFAATSLPGSARAADEPAKGAASDRLRVAVVGVRGHCRTRFGGCKLALQCIELFLQCVFACFGFGFELRFGGFPARLILLPTTICFSFDLRNFRCALFLRC